jgi:hypothetical protein
MSVRPETILLLGAAGIGLLGLLFPLLMRPSAAEGGDSGAPWAAAPVPWARLGIALGVLALLFGLTRLREYPFSPGGTLGNGLAIGGIVALATAALAAFWSGTAAATVGASGGTLLGGALVLLWHRGYPDAALVGFAAGHAVAALLAMGAEGWGEIGRPLAHDQRFASVPPRRPVPLSGLWVGSVTAALLAGAALLAISRSEQLSPAERLVLDGKVYWAWPAALLAAALAGQMIGLTLLARRSWAPVGAGLVAALLLFLLWLRFPRYGPLFVPMAAGFVTALLLLGIGRSGVPVSNRDGQDRQDRGTEPSSSDDPVDPVHPYEYSGTPQSLTTLPALLAPALAVLLLATAYRLYAGYGIALAALGAAALLPWLAEDRGSGSERSAIGTLGRAFLGMLAAAILFRVYYESYNLTNADIPLTAHYVMVGLIAGALSPWTVGVLSGVQEDLPERLNAQDQRQQQASVPPERLSPLLFALGSLLFTVALPLLLALFWGAKAGGGLLLGLVIGQGYRMMAGLLEAGDQERGAARGRVAVASSRVPEAAALVMGWVTVQLLDRAAAFGLQMLQVQRVGLIVLMVVLCVGGIGYLTYRK